MSGTRCRRCFATVNPEECSGGCDEKIGVASPCADRASAVPPRQVPFDRRLLLLVASVVGVVETELPERREVALDPVEP